MTPQEAQMLQDLTNRVNQTSLAEKDAEAEQYLIQTLGRNPDALYILAQTVLVQQYALDQTKKQLDEAHAQSQQLAAPAPQRHTSFLGNLLGMDSDRSQAQQMPFSPVGNPPPPPAQYGSAYPGQTQSSPQYAPVAYAQPAQGGFLRNAMQTAAGVAAGAFAFQGIENLMSGFGHHAGYGGGSNVGDLAGGGPREEVVNNHYGDAAGHGTQESRDIEDRRDDSFGSRLADADTDSTTDDDYGNNNTDTSSDSGDSNYDPGGDDSSF